jgi:outer membrane lipoprotein SlyB
MPIPTRSAVGLLAAALLGALPAARADAQRLRAVPLAAADSALFAPVRADAVRTVALRIAVPDARPDAPARRASGGIARPVLGAVGGAIVGAFIGYFASQVARSDWEDEAGTSDENRRAFAIGGAALGAVAGYAIMRQSPATNDRIPQDGRSASSGEDLDIIVQAEIVESGATNAYDLVQARRPRWLSTRGSNTFREGGRIVGYDDRSVIIEDATDETIVVYLDGAKLGGVRMLREIPVASIVSIRHLDARTATFQYGTGHDHGAIVVLTR